MKILKGILIVTGIFCLFYAGMFFIQATRAISDFRSTTDELHQTAVAATSLVQEAHGRLAGTSQNLNAILIQAGLASDEVRRASAEQRHYWNLIGARTVATLDKTDDTIGSLNTVAVDFDHQLNRVGDSVVMTFGDLDSQIAKLPVADLKALIDNPDIPATLAAVRGASVATEGTAQSVEHVAKHYDEMLTAPKRWYQKLEGWLITGASIGVKFLPPL